MRGIAAAKAVSPTTVRHWLRRHGLKTQPAIYARRDAPKSDAVLRNCALHGWVPFVRSGGVGTYRCGRCNSEAVAE